MNHRSAPATEVVRIAGEQGLSLGLLARRASAPDPLRPPVLLVHGATLGASLFDLPLPGYSLLEALAADGRAAYALDVRGFGLSRPGTVIDGPADAHPPYPRLPQAVADIGAAVDAILAREGARALDIVGFSWGTVTSGAYAAANAAKVARLALYAPLYGERNPLWLGRIAEPDDPGRLQEGIGAYRLMTRADLVARWDADLGGADPVRYREAGVAAAAFDVFAALDAGTRMNGEPAFRCPAGALADLLDVFNGRPLYDPAALTMPVLLVRGADDSTSTDSDARALLAALAAREKAYATIAPGSHFLLLERNRARLHDRLREFLRR